MEILQKSPFLDRHYKNNTMCCLLAIQLCSSSYTTAVHDHAVQSLEPEEAESLSWSQLFMSALPHREAKSGVLDWGQFFAPSLSPRDNWQCLKRFLLSLLEVALLCCWRPVDRGKDYCYRYYKSRDISPQQRVIQPKIPMLLWPRYSWLSTWLLQASLWKNQMRIPMSKFHILGSSDPLGPSSTSFLGSQYFAPKTQWYLR